MSTNDYIKYITQQLVQYYDKPKELRKQQREDKKDLKSSFSFRWFGVIPYALSMLLRKK